MTKTDIAGFAAVDRAADTGRLIEFLDQARTLPGLRIAKSLTLDALQLRPGQVVADIGCGPAEDTLEMARRVAPGGTAIGIDPSRVMLDEARARAQARSLSIQLKLGDVARLPLENGEVDACRADTLLQHLVDPAAAVREMAWVTAPGGRLALLEFDTGTLAVDHPDRQTTAAVVKTLTAMAADGWVGRGLRRLLVEGGLTGVRVEMQAVQPDHGFLRGMLGPAVEQLRVTQAVATATLDRWWTSLARAWVGHSFTACATAFIAGGRLPG